jgi:hypothetical protein
MAHICKSSYSGDRDQEDEVRSQLWANSSQNIPHKNRAGGVAQVVEHLPSQHEAWSETPVLPKNPRKTQKRPLRTHLHRSVLYCKQWQKLKTKEPYILGMVE